MKGFCAIGVWHPKTSVNVGTLWRSAWNYGAAFVFTVGRRYKHQPGDTCKTPYNIPLLHFSDVEDLREHLPYSCPLIGVEQDATAHPLPSFRHPASAAYMLGAEDAGLPPTTLGRCHQVLEIPGSRSCLNVAVAGSIVLYDRHAKELARRVPLDTGRGIEVQLRRGIAHAQAPYGALPNKG